MIPDLEDQTTAIDPKKSKVCHCCKQMGHEAQDCPNDPNIRTNVLYDALDSETIRISKLGSNGLKLSHSESQVSTAHFLKKCAILAEEPSEHDKLNPFNRGAFKFEDFNYQQFNEFILLS